MGTTVPDRCHGNLLQSELGAVKKKKGGRGGLKEYEKQLLKTGSL